MQIESISHKKMAKNSAISFGNRRNKSYYAYMSDNSDNIVKTSIATGSLIGLIRSRKQPKEQIAQSILQDIGSMTFILFGGLSVKYALFNKKN